MSEVAVRAYCFPDGSIKGSAVYVPGSSADARAAAQKGVVSQPDESCEVLAGGVCPIRAAAALAAREERAAENLRRSTRRSVLLLTSYVRHHGLTRLVTLTNGAPGGWATASDALEDAASWLKAGGRAMLGGGAVVVVAEPGTHFHRWHLHLAIKAGGRLDYRALIRSWSRHLTERGYVSTAESGVHRFHVGDESGRHKRGFSSARVAALYLAKYLRKSLGCGLPPGRHRFRVYGSGAVSPLTFRCGSLSTALGALGVHESGCYRLESVNALTGEVFLFGLLFDEGG